MSARPRKPRPPEAELRRLYGAGLSIRDIADVLTLALRREGAAQGLTRADLKALVVSKDAVVRGLAELGIERRPRGHKRSRLDDIPLELLEANVAAEGLRAHARRLGVAAPTLLEHIRTRRGE
jgi:hypothetical protein